MGFLYETHLHTCEASKCGELHGEEYIPYMMGKGYSGMIVTDHFFNGNTCVPADLSWKERVEIYCSGYERALKAAEGKNFKVMFGVEFNFNKDEYLLYGIDKQWLIDNEGIMDMNRRELYEAVHKAGGIMIQAHPFRERDYLDDIKLAPADAVDGIEVYNAANSANMNALGFEFCSKLDLPMTAGSDIHFRRDNEMGGMLFDNRIDSIEEFAAAVIAGKGTPVSVAPDGKITPVADMPEQTKSTELPKLEVLYPEGE